MLAFCDYSEAGEDLTVDWCFCFWLIMITRLVPSMQEIADMVLKLAGQS